MLQKVILISYAIGFALEFLYRSIKAKRVIWPKFINCTMYALTGLFLSFIYFSNLELVWKLVLMFIFPTVVEFIIGYIYLKVKGESLWDYSKESLNFMGIICLKFSFYWFFTSLIFYYLILPFIT